MRLKNALFGAWAGLVYVCMGAVIIARNLRQIEEAATPGAARARAMAPAGPDDPEMTGYRAGCREGWRTGWDARDREAREAAWPGDG